MSKIYYPNGIDIPREIYISTIWFIRYYDQMREEAESLLTSSPVMDGQPRGTKTGDPVAAAAERRERVLRDIKTIEDALGTVPEEYRKAVLDNVARQVPMYKLSPKTYVSESGLQYWRVRFIANVAVNRGMV